MISTPERQPQENDDCYFVFWFALWGYRVNPPTTGNGERRLRGDGTIVLSADKQVVNYPQDSAGGWTEGTLVILTDSDKNTFMQTYTGTAWVNLALTVGSGGAIKAT